MSGTVGGTGSVASLQNAISLAQNALAQGTSNPQALSTALNAATAALGTNGGGAAAPAAAAPAAGNDALNGITTGGGGATTVVGTATTDSGKTVTITNTDGQYKMSPATGQMERVSIKGKVLNFDPNGDKISAFDQVLNQRYHVNLDRSSGLANGLSNLSKIFAANEQRVRDMSDALAQDAADTGQIDPIALQQMSMESSTAQQMSQVQLKIYESMKGAVDAWLQSR